VWFFLGGRRWSRLNYQPTPLFEFRLPPEYYPASPSRRTAACRLLSWTSSPYSTSGTEGPLTAGFPCPLRSALRVWSPSRRFPPFDPPPVFFHTGSAHGIHPSELSPSGKPPQRFRFDAPTYRLLPQVQPPAEADGPDLRAAVPGLLLPEVPGDRPCV